MSDFWTTGMGSGLLNTDSKNVPQSLRQKIALAMLMQKRAYPKTFGEGLGAIGDALGDRYGIMGIEKDAAAAEVARQKGVDEYTGAAPAAPSVKAASYASPDSIEPGAPQTAPQAPPVLATMQSQHPDMLTQQKQPLVTTPPPATALARTPVVGPEYNMLDAQAGMPRRGQGRVQDALVAAFPGNPDMQAYGSQLAAGEQQVPGDTSKTGARGPWQFVPGTARQYGLANPDDPMASAQALKAFTADNAATFERINGRPPTMADLSLMHQQGGATGANMVAGTGNASPRNLALNNVPPGAGPQAAATQIKGYYGLPERPVDARGAATAALVAQQQPPAGLPPEITGGASQPDQRLAFNGAQPPAPAGIKAAPPPPQAQIQQAPPPGQPQQGPGPGYVLKLGPEPIPPPTMTPGMVRIQNIIKNTPPSQRESVAAGLQPYLDDERAKLAQQNVVYQDELKSRHEMRKLQEEQRQKADKDIRDARTDSQKWITTAPSAGTVGGGPQGPDPRLGTPQSPQRAGPTIGPVPAGDIPERWSKQEAEKIDKQKESYQKAQPELTETLDIIDKINKHPAKPYATGMFSGVTALTPSGKGFTALNEQLMGKNLVDAYQKLQGTGQIGEKEGANFAKARARLTAAASEKDYNEALKDLGDTVRGTLERAQRNLKMPVTAWQKTNDDAYAPDVGEVQDGHEYLGGDPGNPRSWRKAR